MDSKSVSIWILRLVCFGQLVNQFEHRMENLVSEYILSSVIFVFDTAGEGPTENSRRDSRTPGQIESTVLVLLMLRLMEARK